MIPLMLRMMASEAAMMGRQSGDQDSLFYQFRLDDRIPKDHLLRRINVFVTLVLRYDLKQSTSKLRVLRTVRNTLRLLAPRRD